jgi:hypothetical protein
VLAVLAALLLPALAGASMLQRFETDTLSIRTPDGAVHEFTVELAITQEQRSQGLMYRRELARDSGMLFLYPRSGVHAMWMKNTYIPLDMLFVKADGRVVHIAERTVPQSRRSISAGERVKAVLELRGGTADRLGIGEGAVVLHEAFGTAEPGS